MSKPINYDFNVFINCAFDDEFIQFFRAIVFTILDCGYIPRCAWEVDDGTQNRIDKIFKIIGDCRFGVHDISRTELDENHELPRFNMPLELGMFLGAATFGRPQQRRKICMIMDTNGHRFQKFISDISGRDIKSHQGVPENTIKEVRNWLRNNTSNKIKLPGPLIVQEHFNEFSDEFPENCEKVGVDPKEVHFKEFVVFVEEWLKNKISIPAH